MHIEGTCADIDLSFTNGVSEAKVIKNRHKKFCPPVYEWGDLSVCLSFRKM